MGVASQVGQTDGWIHGWMHGWEHFLWFGFHPHSIPLHPLLLHPCLFSTHDIHYFPPLPNTHTHTHTCTHTYVHMHRWPNVEYVNRHLLQYPISSPHHVSDMLMQPTQFLHSTSSPPFFASLCFLSSAPTYPSLPTWADEAEEGKGREGERASECIERGFKQNLIMMLLWMDVTHTNRHVSSSEKQGLLENNSRESRRGFAECGRKDKSPSSGTLCTSPFLISPFAQISS